MLSGGNAKDLQRGAGAPLEEDANTNTSTKHVQFALETDINTEKRQSPNIKVKQVMAFGSKASLNLLFDEGAESESDSESDIKIASERNVLILEKPDKNKKQSKSKNKDKAGPSLAQTPPDRQQKSQVKEEALAAERKGKSSTGKSNPITSSSSSSSSSPSLNINSAKNSLAKPSADRGDHQGHGDLTPECERASPSRETRGGEDIAQCSAELEEDTRLTRLSSLLLLCVLLIAGLCILFDDTLTVMYRGGNGVHLLLQAHGYDGLWRPHKESVQKAHHTVRTHRYVPHVLTDDAWMEQTGLRSSPTTEFAIHIISPRENDIVTKESSPMLDIELTGEALLQSYYRAVSFDSDAGADSTVVPGERHLTEMNASFVVRIDGWELNFTSGSHLMVPIQQSREPLHIKLNLLDYGLADGVHLLDVAMTLHNTRHTNLSSSSVAALNHSSEHSDSCATSSVAFFYLSDPQQFARRYQYLSQRVAAGEDLGDALVAPYHELSPEVQLRANAGDAGHKSYSGNSASDSNIVSDGVTGTSGRMPAGLVSAEFPSVPEEILAITSPLNNFLIPEQLGEKAAIVVFARVRPSAIFSTGAVMHLVFDGNPYDISTDVRAQVSAKNPAISTENHHVDKEEFATFSVNISGFVREASHSVQLALSFEHETRRMTFTTQVLLSSKAIRSIESSLLNGLNSEEGSSGLHSGVD
jgi:hypothetical protein